MFGRVRVPRERLRAGNLYWVDQDGVLRDLGPATLEDLKLVAYIGQEAYRVGRRIRASIATLGRVRILTTRMFDKASDKE